jgi:hypothetical protein
MGQNFAMFSEYERVFLDVLGAEKALVFRPETPVSVS